MKIPRLKVTVHPLYFQGLEEGSSEYNDHLTIAKEFASYWRTGYHPDFGRDKPVDRPDGIHESGLCKVHVLAFKLSRASQVFWNSKSSCRLAPYDRSHCTECDSLLLYAVSEEGTALILALYIEDGHERLKTPYYSVLRGLGEHAKAYFKSIGEQPALEKDLLAFLQTPTC
ncbi:TPA: hypothetical protein JLB58_004265 [Escherichia coli]|uniref:hypothetical protein n=1 Tax=Acinetobacter soli TaxID=487316 RepID=UPI0026E08723|nr:hypothetical protein [Acinetobacter soli]HAV8071944.1 hypothetical protein [Escherichia coli]